MHFLFTTHGKHIANFVDGHLYTPSGDNIGHHVEAHRIFIDLHGRYLGEILHENRLLQRLASPYLNSNFGSQGNHGNIGSHGTPPNPGAVGHVSGYEDIPESRLRR